MSSNACICAQKCNHNTAVRQTAVFIGSMTLHIPAAVFWNNKSAVFKLDGSEGIFVFFGGEPYWISCVRSICCQREKNWLHYHSFKIYLSIYLWKHKQLILPPGMSVCCCWLPSCSMLVESVLLALVLHRSLLRYSTVLNFDTNFELIITTNVLPLQFKMLRHSVSSRKFLIVSPRHRTIVTW